MDDGVMLILGKPGSGKSTIISKILRTKCAYGGNFDFYIVVSPSGIPDCNLNEEYTCDSLNMGWIMERLSSIAELIPTLKQERTIRIMIVFDDVVGELKKLTSSPLFSKLIFNRRHMVKGASISLIITSQKFTTVPPMVRTSVTHLILMNTSYKDVDDLRGELLATGRREFADLFTEYILNAGTSNPHLFIRMIPL